METRRLSVNVTALIGFISLALRIPPRSLPISIFSPDPDLVAPCGDWPNETHLQFVLHAARPLMAPRRLPLLTVGTHPRALSEHLDIFLRTTILSHTFSWSSACARMSWVRTALHDITVVTEALYR